MMVPVDPLREAFLRSGLTAGEVARRLGLPAEPGRERVRQRLGLRPCSSRGHRGLQRHMRYETACRYAAALDVDPWEVGL